MTTPQVLNITDRRGKQPVQPRFGQPFEALLAKAKELEVDLDPETNDYCNKILFEEYEGTAPLTKRAYNDTLTGFWKFLVAKDKYEEMFLLLHKPPDNCPSFRVSTITDFLELRIIDEERWGKTGSESSIEVFKSAIKMLFLLSNTSQSPYIHVKPGNPITSKRVTWPRGNPFESPLCINAIAKIKKHLRDFYVNQGRDALTPKEQQRVYEHMLQKAANDIYQLQIAVIIRLGIATGLRISDIVNIKYKDIDTSLTRANVAMPGELTTLGLILNGKGENRAVSAIKGKGSSRAIVLVHRNNLSRFVCPLTAIVLWVKLLAANGVDFTKNENLYLFANKTNLVKFDMTVGFEVNTQIIAALKGVFDQVISGDKGTNQRNFGSHTMRKTFVFNSILAGQEIIDADGNKKLTETNRSDLAKTARMANETLENSYIKDNATFISTLRKEARESYVNFIQPFQPGHLAEVGKNASFPGQKYHFSECNKISGSGYESKSILTISPDFTPSTPHDVYLIYHDQIVNAGANKERLLESYRRLQVFMAENDELIKENVAEIAKLISALQRELPYASEIETSTIFRRLPGQKRSFNDTDNTAV